MGLYNDLLGFSYERFADPPKIAAFVYLCNNCPGFTLTSRPSERPDVSAMNLSSLEVVARCESQTAGAV